MTTTKQPSNRMPVESSNRKPNDIYWAYNLPLQVWPEDGDTRLVNYMARKERCCDVKLSEVIGEQTREQFFEDAAIRLENLARLMREAGKDPTLEIYYPDRGLEAADDHD